MPRSTRLVVLLATAIVLPLTVHAQERKLGLSMSITNDPRIGLLIATSPKIAIRPAVVFQSRTIQAGPGGDIHTTTATINVDILKIMNTLDRLRTYLGVGAGVGNTSSNTLPDQFTWGIRGLFGARVRVLDRLEVFGEMALQYSHSDDGEHFASLGAMPVGVIFFLK